MKAALRGMFYVCVSHFLGRRVSWSGLGHLPLICSIAWIQPDPSVTEMGEVIQEPARLEHGGSPTSSRILVVLDGPIGWINFHLMTVKGHVDAP